MEFNKYHKGDLSDSSFLVTGGAGFIGSNIVHYLMQYGAKKVRVLDNFSTGNWSNIEMFLDHPNFELIEGDIRNMEHCKNSIKDIDYISHQAALGSVPRSINDPVTSNEVNISGFLNMLVAAKDGSIKKMVYAASSSTYGDHPALPKKEEHIGKPLSPYAITKFVNELYGDIFSKTYQFHTIGLRYFNVFGPRQNPKGPYAAVIPLFIQSNLKNNRPFINGDGLTSRDFTFVANAVQANIKAMLKEDITQHEVINIAFGKQTTLLELWNYICEINDNAIQPEFREERQGDVRHSLADIQKAQRLIAYDPTYSIKNGLVITNEWYKNNIN